VGNCLPVTIIVRPSYCNILIYKTPETRSLVSKKRFNERVFYFDLTALASESCQLSRRFMKHFRDPGSLYYSSAVVAYNNTSFQQTAHLMKQR